MHRFTTQDVERAHLIEGGCKAYPDPTGFMPLTRLADHVQGQALQFTESGSPGAHMLVLSQQTQAEWLRILAPMIVAFIALAWQQWCRRDYFLTITAIS